MSNDENKQHINKLILSEWQNDKNAKKVHDREMFYVCAKECYWLSSDDSETVWATPVNALSSFQE